MISNLVPNASDAITILHCDADDQFQNEHDSVLVRIRTVKFCHIVRRDQNCAMNSELNFQSTLIININHCN